MYNVSTFPVSSPEVSAHKSICIMKDCDISKHVLAFDHNYELIIFHQFIYLGIVLRRIASSNAGISDSYTGFLKAGATACG